MRSTVRREVRWPRVARLLCLTVAPSLLACGGQRTAVAPPIRGDVAFVDTTVVPMDRAGLVPHQTVVVAGDRVVAVGRADETRLAPGVTRVDGRGRFLAPGLADMHVHIWDEQEVPLYVVCGVTTIRNMWGEAQILAIRTRIREGEMVGPEIVTAGRVIDGKPRIWDGSDEVADATQARAVVQRQLAEPYDFLKVYTNLSAEAFTAIAQAARAAKVPLAGHVPNAVSLEEALRSGIASIEHLTGFYRAIAADGVDVGSGYRSPELLALAKRIKAGELTIDQAFDPVRRSAMAELSAQMGVANAPTLIVLRTTMLTRAQAAAQFRRPEMAYVFPPIREFWNPDNDFRRRKFTDADLELLQMFLAEALRDVAALQRAGAMVLAGSDAPNPFVFHGLSLHEELALLVEAGLTPYEAIRTATVNPAVFLGRAGLQGVVAEGTRADLVLLAADPLQDVSNYRAIQGVMVRGRWLDAAALSALKAETAAAYASPPDWFTAAPPPADPSGLAAAGRATLRLTRKGVEIGAERVAFANRDGRRVWWSEGREKEPADEIASYTVRIETDAGGTWAGYRRHAVPAGAGPFTTTCDGRTCATSMDGAPATTFAAPASLVFSGAAVELYGLAERLQKVTVGATLALDVAVVNESAEVKLRRRSLKATRDPDEAVVANLGMVEARVFSVTDAEGKAFGRLWVDARTAQPVRAELVDSAERLVWQVVSGEAEH